MGTTEKGFPTRIELSKNAMAGARVTRAQGNSSEDAPRLGKGICSGPHPKIVEVSVAHPKIVEVSAPHQKIALARRLVERRQSEKPGRSSAAHRHAANHASEARKDLPAEVRVLLMA